MTINIRPMATLLLYYTYIVDGSRDFKQSWLRVLRFNKRKVPKSLKNRSHLCFLKILLKRIIDELIKQKPLVGKHIPSMCSKSMTS